MRRITFAARLTGAAALCMALGACDSPERASVPDPLTTTSTPVSGAGASATGLGVPVHTDSMGGVVTGDSAAGPVPSDTARPELPIADVRLEVDVAARQLRLFRDQELLATHPVAVGTAEWPTRTGEWYVTQVVWNPEWIPPEESWAEKEEGYKPGDPKNPLGAAQLVYDPPRSIHGTIDPSSIGKAASHGSIRVTNAVARTLARTLMEQTGTGKDESWYSRARTNRTEKLIVDLPERVPIRVF